MNEYSSSVCARPYSHARLLMPLLLLHEQTRRRSDSGCWRLIIAKSGRTYPHETLKRAQVYLTACRKGLVISYELSNHTGLICLIYHLPELLAVGVLDHAKAIHDMQHEKSKMKLRFVLEGRP